MAGVSMGGFVTFKAMMNDDRIKTAVSLIGSPYWEDIPGQESLPLFLSVDRNEILMEKLKAYSLKYSPNYFPEKFTGKSLLIQNGADDKHVHIERVKEFYETVKTKNGENGAMRLIVFPKTKHEVNAQMIKNTVDWFSERL